MMGLKRDRVTRTSWPYRNKKRWIALRRALRKSLLSQTVSKKKCKKIECFSHVLAEKTTNVSRETFLYLNFKTHIERECTPFYDSNKMSCEMGEENFWCLSTCRGFFKKDGDR